MRLRYFIVLLICGIAAIPAFAQDTPIDGYWLDGEALKQYSNLYVVSHELNICVEDLIAANPDTLAVSFDSNRYYEPLPAKLFIPSDAPTCYEKVKLKDDESINPEAALQQMLQERNLCVEGVMPILPEGGGGIDAGFVLYIPIDTLPCYNEQGERLRYFAADGSWLPEPIYSSDKIIKYSYETQTQLEYCFADVLAANPQIGMISSYALIDVFVNDTMRRCDELEVLGEYPHSETLYEVSTRINVCMEEIVAANVWIDRYHAVRNSTLHIPQDTSPCYDENGLRIGQNDRAKHSLERGDGIFDVAQQYNVCLDDLLAANPLIDRRGYYNLPTVLFIPDTSPCNYAYPIEHQVEEGDSLLSLSKLYNVCFNRIVDATGEANIRYKNGIPTEEGYTPLIVAELEPGSVVLIPDRPDCYTFNYEGYTYEMQTHICYFEAVDFTKDYTGHEPPISFTYETESGHCSEYGEQVNMLTVIFGNETLQLYNTHGNYNMVTTGQCFGVDPYELLRLQTRYESSGFPWGYIVLPSDYNRDCYLITADAATRYQKAMELSYKAGYVDENGIYTVNYNDTLGSIGRKYGYLPQWIAEYNNLPDTRMIYYRQELKLPPYPSLYDFAKLGIAVVGTLTVSGIIFGVYRWRTSGKRKRKNDEKVA